ncbi:hypothetical protein SUGI_0969590 [Cryptomeria japonica]|uniref:serine/arginine-rich splicing factor RS31 n=1 Tax=Cryptomeria japonica TaxID=3369 RepID=UPI002414C029|nr:serine/arginine-rich splicing factor RS31 [Cryptomeria japonica]XP_057828247.2 serine/arginine-rich splicing factor RS31 [Cryptomeria japonica]XP_057828248.2 serine/arginine-rich splicing factor RS31 [Cryptomeria japonica]XP_057828249.2 serine/arginine-rich splicing factor RS31 [Cryptomeria japonica]GLJ46025.1 hypothetical protein SUGI_0969590 [Cryptomeria japonica]
MKPVYCGNLEYGARHSEVERLFSRYGRVDRVDVKSGFAFIYMDDERDAEDAIRGLDKTEFGRQRRRLCVEWTKQADRGSHRSENGKRSSRNLKPAKTLFVINFDPANTMVRDLERHFEPYGKVLNVRMRRNFAFIQYESQKEATKALNSTDNSKVLDKVISVEYAQRDDGDRGSYGRSAENRDRSLSPKYDRRPVRGSPDYGRATSPVNARRPERDSPDYGRAASPVNARRPERDSPDYGRAVSPINARRAESGSPDYGRAASPVYPRRYGRVSPGYARASSPIHERYRSRSPLKRSRS